MRKIVPLTIIALLLSAWALVACVGAQPKSVARGEQLATELGCYGCHGDQGTGAIANPGSPLGTVPGWQTKAFAEAFGDENGKPDREKITFMINKGAEAYYVTYMAYDEAAQTVARTISEWQRVMPGYEDQLTAQEVEDLVDFVTSLNPYFEE